MIKLHSFSIGVAAATLLFSGFAHAESFTFTTNWEPAEVKAATVGARTITLSSVKGNVVLKWASGTESRGAVECNSWSGEPGATFETIGICNATYEDGGKLELHYGCTFTNEAKTESNCWSVNSGTGGKVNGPGTTSWNSKGNKAAGGGQVQ